MSVRLFIRDGWAVGLWRLEHKGRRVASFRNTETGRALAALCARDIQGADVISLAGPARPVERMRKILGRFARVEVEK